MRSLRVSLTGTVVLALLGGLSSVAVAQETTAEDAAQPFDGQAIAERVNEAINGCDVVACDVAPFEAAYAPDSQLIVDGAVLADGVDAVKDAARAADGMGNSYRLIAPVAEYRASDGDLYVAQWVEVTGPGHPAGDPILSIMQVRDGKVVRQYDTTPPFSWAAAAAE